MHKLSTRLESTLTTTGPLDATDLALLEALQSDGRASIATLAQAAGIARATAYNRIARLERDGVITGYAACVNHDASGLGLTAIVLLNGGQKAWKPLQALLVDLPQVEKAWYVTGIADVLLVVRCRDVGELRQLVLERLQRLPDIRGTQTMLTLEQVVDRPFVVASAAPEL